MTRLIIICGLSATGKTTLANELSKKLGIFCIHKDSIKESLFESLKLSTLEDSKKIGYPAVHVALDLARENLQRGVDVILESPFNYSDVGKVFETWKQQCEIDIFTIVLELDEKLRKTRFEEREKGKERHHAHHDTDRLRMYEEKRADYEYMPLKKIFLNSDRPLENLIDDAVKFLAT